jgi:hypothetical protein
MRDDRNHYGGASGESALTQAAATSDAVYSEEIGYGNGKKLKNLTRSQRLLRLKESGDGF